MIRLLHLGGYPFSFLLCVGRTHDEITRHLKRKRDGHACTPSCWQDWPGLNLSLNVREQKFARERARFVNFGGCGTMLLLLDSSLRRRSTLTMVFLAHESLHMTRHVMEMIRCPLDDSSEEAWAYLQMDIVARVLGALS